VISLKAQAQLARVRRETVCPFCGQPLSWVQQPDGVVHGLPLCKEFGADVLAYLRRAAAQVALNRRAHRRASA
jgi:hypothetical protein